MTHRPKAQQSWGAPQAMTKALTDLRRILGDSDVAMPSGDVMQSSLRHFASTQEARSFTELKYVCYGVTLPVGAAGWRIIDRPPLFEKLISLVEAREGQPRQFRRCYQGLLNGYFGYDRSPDAATAASTVNWGRLRGFLDHKLDPLMAKTRLREAAPGWIETLLSHRNLLTSDPCTRYAKALAGGDRAPFRQVCTELGIPATSWVWEDALMAYVQTVCGAADPAFHAGLPGILDLVNARSDLRLPRALATRAAALAVARYARCARKPVHEDLRDTCVERIGDPWLHRVAWDADVRSDPAREMVGAWINRALIRDFFKLLAQDGAADVRRLDYWLKWELEISGMWFVLGADARRNKSKPFLDLRKLMAERERALAGNDGQNNAFIMRIGPLMVIEFGLTNNACYVFAASDFKTDLGRQTFSIDDLKQRALAKRLSHTPGWEPRFDMELRTLLRTVPAERGELRPVIRRPTGR
ncbi:EH signature domain-containing protein [Variovorax robiniae]|uniref:EH signature domain-containing protein n=1 Tax=Variovorax robiniae TaxID=1836199 RepID=A0ABU8XFJ0_9BURK